MLATPTHDHEGLSAFPATQTNRKKGTRKNRTMERDTPLVEYLCSRPESQRQNRIARDASLTIQVPLQEIASPHHEHGTCGLPFLSTTRVKSVPLPVMYIKQQHILNKGIKNVPLHSDRFIPVPKRSRLRSDSLLNLHQKKTKFNRLHEHLIAGEQNLEQSRHLKLQSEIIPHRLNHRYYMSGKEMTLKDRYAVPEEELLRLRNLNLTANAALYYGKGMSQKKIKKGSKDKQLLEVKLDGREDDESILDLNAHKSVDKDSADSADDLLSESEPENKDIDDKKAETTSKANERPQVSITLTSGGPSKTFMTDLKTVDLSMLDDITDENMMEIYRKRFNELDIDGSGSITLDELRASLFGAASEGDIQFIMSVSEK